MLQDIRGEARKRKLARSISEMDCAVGGAIQIVGTAERDAPCFGTQSRNRAIRRYQEQAFIGVGDYQVISRIENQAERPAMSVGEAFRVCAVRLQAHNPAVFHASIDAPL